MAGQWVVDPCGRGECAEGNEFFKSSIAAVAFDMTMKEPLI